MAATSLVRASTRVAMVWPHRALVQRDILDLRGDPRADAELVDQAHHGESVRLLGEHGEWRYVQAEDQYFGWASSGDLGALSVYGESHYVAVLLADVREAAEPLAEVLARLPVGTHIPRIRATLQDTDGKTRDFPYDEPDGWKEIGFVSPRRARSGFVATADLVDVRDLPHRYPTSVDLLNTAGAFMGVPYLWGGTTALGMDCSGLVQQVYRLNGLALPRDADQQAMLGRRVDEARAGDLFFFGAESVTHVALATSSTEFIHAPMKGGVVEHGRLGGDRKLRAIRRYLPDVITP